MSSAAEARRRAKKVNFVSSKELKKIRDKSEEETEKKVRKATKWFLKNISKASKKGLFEVELYYSHEKIFKLGRFSSYKLRKDYLLLDEFELSHIIHKVKEHLETEDFGFLFVKCEKPKFISGQTLLEYQIACSDASRHTGPFTGYHINSIIVSW